MTLSQVQATPLPQKDLVDVYATGYRFLVQKATFKPRGVYLLGMEDRPELERKVRAALSDLPTVAYNAYVPSDRLMLYLSFDVIDRNHALFWGTLRDNEPIGGVVVRTGKTWKAVQPSLPAKDRGEIQRVGMLYVLRKAEHPYSAKDKTYVGLIQRGGRARVGTNEAVDPSPEMMRMLWRLGYHVKPVSEHPYSYHAYSPPRSEFGVGEIQAIDSKRAVVSIVRGTWYKEPGYNPDFGPDSASLNSLLVVKQNGKWVPKGLRGYWRYDPAE